MNDRSAIFDKTGAIDTLPVGGTFFSLFGKFRSAATVMEQNGGAGPGFDALRIGLSLCILWYHGTQNAYGPGYTSHVPAFLYPVILALLPMFFCLSGFLVTGSAVRTRSVPVFLTYRGLRIFPALAVEVTLSALLLGPMVTSLPLADYFSGREFWEYFGNIVSIIRYTLPGVFTDNPVPHIVNVSLWTLRPEFYCYVMMAFFMFSGLVYKRLWYTLAFAGATAALTILNIADGFGAPTSTFPWHVILYYFFVGIFFFHWKEYVPIHFSVFVAAAALSYFMLPVRGLSYVVALPLTYCIVYLGMLKVPRLPLLQNGDYSYGIYLFHFPIQQALVYFFPVLREWWLLLPVAAPLTVLFAAGSWHWIEKPSLGLKKRLFPTPSPKPVPSS
ncbi:MAG: acyltransferase [Burkholderiales bacterium]|nr:acyltransferase [Burkholderiales bacterium]